MKIFLPVLLILLWTNVASGSRTLTGMASWYGPGFHGRITANGETYDQNKMTAAMVVAPLGSIVKVTRVDTGVSIVVRINDRGPYAVPIQRDDNGKLVPHPKRIIDLSKEAAVRLGMIHRGVAPVKVELLELPKRRTRRHGR